MATIGQTPLNQQNALPILTVAQNAQAGEVNVVGGSVSKYFDGSAAGTGIGGINATLAGGFTYLVSNFMDLRGCSRGVGLLRRVNAVGDAVDRALCILDAQYRRDHVTAPPVQVVVAGLSQANSIARVNLINTGLIFKTHGAATPIDDLMVMPWASENPAGSAANARPLAMGSDVRFIIDWSTAANPPGVNDFFTFTLWASN